MDHVMADGARAAARRAGQEADDDEHHHTGKRHPAAAAADRARSRRDLRHDNCVALFVISCAG